MATALRSMLSVPGDQEKMVASAASRGADMVLLDLEDSVAATAKPLARARAAQALREVNWGDTRVGVRINSWDSPWLLEDLDALVTGGGAALNSVMLPKAESPHHVGALDLVLSQLERRHGRWVRAPAGRSR